MKKVLIITPKFPYPATGACEQDRAAGIEFFLRNGWEVKIITKVYTEKYQAAAVAEGKKRGIEVVPVPYKYLYGSAWWKKIWRALNRLARPWYLDGAAYEYSEPQIRRELLGALENYRPDLVWVDYTYLWPLYGIIKKAGVPIVTRSVNFEPRHFLEEDGVNILNIILYLPKLLSEILTARKSDVLAVLNPNEAKIYRLLGARRIFVLPLRGLPPLLGKNTEIKDHAPLHVLYMSSTYQVAHNRRAANFFISQIIPRIKEKFPGEFVFHFLGSKFPDELLSALDGETARYEGYVPAEQMENFLSHMDIAVSPSAKRVGMQQKVFEPLVRGLPLITSPQNLVGYPFRHQESVFLAESPEEYVDALRLFRESVFRKKLSANAVNISVTLFSAEKINAITRSVIDSVS